MFVAGVRPDPIFHRADQRRSYLILASDSSVEALTASLATQMMVRMTQIPDFTFGGLVHGTRKPGARLGFATPELNYEETQYKSPSWASRMFLMPLSIISCRTPRRSKSSGLLKF